MPHEDMLVTQEISLLPGEFPDEEEETTPDTSRRENLIGRMLQEAVQWREENLEPDQERATNYYKGDISDDVKNVAGRSKAVSRDVSDTVRMILPALSDIFFGPDSAVEFEPTEPNDVEMAKQVTRYIDKVVIRKDNQGKKIMRGNHKDALVRRLGIIKAWWDESPTPILEAGEHTGMTAEQIALLQKEMDTEVEVFGPDENGLFDARVMRDLTRDNGRVKFDVMPPEEIVWSPDARSPEDARLIAHIREMPANEAIEMGFDPEIVNRHKGPSQMRNKDGLDAARRIDDAAWSTEEDTQAEETRPVLVAEAYVKLPVIDISEDGEDADGSIPIALHRIWALGEGESWEIVEEDVWDFLPFAFFGPDPEPHTFVGGSIADLVEDIQRIKSQILRGILDSLSAHLDPAMEVGPGVNMNDVLNQERGRVIRVERQGMLREINTEFVGADGLAVFQAMDAIKTARTGVSPESQGLDAEKLQSTTPGAVDAVVKAAEAQIKEIAWIFAEGYAELYRIIFRLLIKHQTHPRTVRFGADFTNIDPRDWNADLDVTVKVGIGANQTNDKINELVQIAAKQEEHLQAQSPLGDHQKLLNTYTRINELQGLNPSEYWPTPEELQQKLQQAQEQPPEPSAEERLEKIEMAKVESRERTETLKAQTDITIKQMDTDQKTNASFLQALAKDAENALKREQAEVATVQGALE